MEGRPQIEGLPFGVDTDGIVEYFTMVVWLMYKHNQNAIYNNAYVTYWFCIHIQIETPSCDPATSNGPFDGAVVEEVPIQRKFIFT